MPVSSWWFRLNADWGESHMFDELSYADRMVWPLLLGECKLKGNGGRFRLNRRGMKATYGCSDENIDAMIECARKHGALVIHSLTDDEYEIVNWSKYQQTSTDRTRAWREKKRASPADSCDVTVTGVTSRDVTQRHTRHRDTTTTTTTTTTATPTETPPTPPAGGDGTDQPKPPAAVRRKREPKPTTPGHAEAKAAYFDAFEARYGAKPPWAARDAVTLNDILASFNGEPRRATAAIARFFRDADPFVAGSGHPLGLLRSRVGRYASDHQTPHPGAPAETRVGNFFPNGQRRT